MQKLEIKQTSPGVNILTDYKDDDIADEIIDEDDIIAEECESPKGFDYLTSSNRWVVQGSDTEDEVLHFA